MNQEIILSKVDLEQDFGKTLNHLQNIAKKVLSKKEFDIYLELAGDDIEECEGMDGMLLNGCYFDWKEFSYKQREIVSAWLSYFNETQLGKIAKAL